MSAKVLHIGSCNNFIIPFIEFVRDELNNDFIEHKFLLTGKTTLSQLLNQSNIKIASSSKIGQIQHYINLAIEMNKADKIILHNLFNWRVYCLLFLMPWLYHKTYWIIWGADLYTYQLGKHNKFWHIKEFIRRPVIKNMGHLVTYIPGDVDLARKWYGAKGEYHECLMYLSNTYKALDAPSIESDTINIQIGNSADSSNNHFEILDKLLPFKNQNIKIYAPLSYGDQAHAKKVIATGKELFGEKFIALTEYIPFEQYLQFLGSIDIAIFNHKRQQAMGNTITLLGLGKTVFIRSDTTQWQFFKDKNIEVYDSIKLDSIDKKEHLDNIIKVKEYFSEETLIKQYSEIF